MPLSDGQDMTRLLADMGYVEVGSYTPREAAERIVELALCTCDDGCKAEADSHMPDCPVEELLREEFGGL